jgi:hypothetical protein
MVSANSFLKTLHFLKVRDQIIIGTGCVFFLFFMLFFNIRGLQLAFSLFILPYLLASITVLPERLINRVYLIIAALVAIEALGEFFIFNNHLFGLDHLWHIDTDSIVSYRQRYNPLRDPTSVSDFRASGSIYRVDGIFGYPVTTGSYLAVAAAYTFELARQKKGKYFFAFVLFLLGALTSASIVVVFSISITILFSLFIDLKNSLCRRILLFFILLLFFLLFLNSSFGHLITLRVGKVISTNFIINALIPDVSDRFDLLRLLIGFNHQDTYARESDIVRLFSAFGLIPVMFFLLSGFKEVIRSFRISYFSKYYKWHRAVSMGVWVGF